MPLRLRAFHPALVLCAHTGNAARALEVQQAIAAAGLDLSEPEFGLLLEATAKGGTYEQFVGACPSEALLYCSRVLPSGWAYP